MSKLTEAFHSWVDSLGLSPETAVLVHKYGMYVVWAVLIGVPLLFFVRGC